MRSRLYAEVARILRFGVSGGLATVTSYLSFLLLLKVFGAPYLAAYLVACVLGIGLGYLLNSGWTFGRGPTRSWRQALTYAVAQVCLLSALGWLLTFEVKHLHWRPELGALINVPIGAALGFVVMRWGVFRRGPNLR